MKREHWERSDPRRRVGPRRLRRRGGRAAHALPIMAFTLLEVMMAIAILAMCLTAIFSSEGGAVRMSARSRRLGLATLLARCKMGEIEEQVSEEGLPALFDSGNDECCEEGEVDGYECKWEIVPIVLPETMFAPEEGAAGGGGGDPLANKGSESENAFDPAAMMESGDTGGIASAALGYVFPILKPAFEQQIRRATVVVQWREGDVPKELDVTQYLVSQTPITVPTEGETGATPGTGTGTGTGQSSTQQGENPGSGP
jgi:general secretion pathway protein I